MAGEQGLPHAERVQGAQHRVRAIGEAARIAGQPPGVPVTGRIDGDDQKSLTSDAAEHAQVRAAAQQQAMHEDQRDSPPADGEPDVPPVVEFDDVMGQPDPALCCHGHCRADYPRPRRATTAFGPAEADLGRFGGCAPIAPRNRCSNPRFQAICPYPGTRDQSIA